MEKTRTVRKRLESIIASKNMTLYQFCTHYGLPYSTISAIVKGDSDPKFSTIEEIAEVMDMPLAQLVLDDTELDAAKDVSSENLDLYMRICRFDKKKKWRMVGYMDCLDEENN